MNNPPTHTQREQAFEKIFGTVRADSGGTGMGSSDAERDAALKNISFDKLPSSISPCTLPEPAPRTPELPPTEDIKPLELDAKTKTFVALFDHVTPAQKAAYGGQSVQPDADIAFEKLPQKMQTELPDVQSVEKGVMDEVQSAREAKGKLSREPSARYTEAHDKYVKIFGDVEAHN